MDVCSCCFADLDLRKWIREYNGPRGCDFCNRHDAPTAPLSELGRHMRHCLARYWSRAVDELPYDNESDSGYAAPTWDTDDILFNEVGLELPRDMNDQLAGELPSAVSEELWCDFDWTTLDHDKALATSWDSFCKILKHERRFFFSAIEQDPDDRDHYSPAALLDEMSTAAVRLGLVKTLPAQTRLYRARPCARRRHFSTAEDLGPPPAKCAIQANRMNPPGIPMFYAADRRKVAIAEVRARRVSVGTFQLLRNATILDLADLPPIPGIFADHDRWVRLTLRFLYAFRNDIAKPVPRDDRMHVDYIPTQVVTEYFRHCARVNSVDGIRYPSTAAAGTNVVLFATQRDVEGTPAAIARYHWQSQPWLRLLSTTGVALKRLSRTPKPLIDFC